jgi:hypothetical protein
MKVSHHSSHSGDLICRRCHVRLLLADESQYNPNSPRMGIRPLTAQVPVVTGETKAALRLANLQIGEIENRWSLFKVLLSRWYHYVKSFEEKDNLMAAHREGRLHIRWIRDGIDKVHPAILALPMDSSKLGKSYAGKKLDVGVRGIKKRLIPGNLDRSYRVPYGLHSLSGSLLNPNYPICIPENPGKFRQIHTWEPNGDWFAFTALLPVGDQALIIRLYEIAESTTRSDIKNGIEWFTQRITHTRYAYPTDMATGYIAIPQGDSQNPVDFEYIPKRCLPIEKKSGLQKPIGNKLLQRRVCRGYAAAYPLVLTLRPKDKNEVTIEYREHNGVFPMFCKCENLKFVKYDVPKSGNPTRGNEVISADHKL